MAIEVLNVRTTNDAGEITRSFRGADTIVLNIDYVATEIPRNTSVAATFFIRQVVDWPILDDSVVDFAFAPYHWFSFRGRISAGSWTAWASWRFPRRDPTPAAVPRRDWPRLINENWRFRDWPGWWNMTGFVSFTAPPRRGVFDHSKENWIYQLSY